MITWLGRPRWLGQQEPKSPEDAAADAAYNEALKADWPPKRDDVQNIGKAAGGAAGDATCVALAAETGGITAIAAATGICSDIGQAIGEYLGGAIYDIVESFWADTVYVAPQYDYVIARRLRGSALRLAKLRGTNDWMAEAQRLQDWGVPGATLITLHDGRGAYGSERGPWLPYYSEGGLKDYLHKIAAAESALASEIIAQQKLEQLPRQSRKSSALPVVIGLAAAAGIAWVLFAL